MWLPAMRTDGRRIDQGWRPSPIGGRVHDGPMCLGVEPLGPIHEGERFAREKLPRDPVQDIQVAVLTRLQDDLARLARDREVRQDQLVGRVVVPALPRDFLVIPRHLSGVGVDRDDRGNEQLVPLTCRVVLAVIGRRIGRTNVEGEIQLRVVVGKRRPTLSLLRPCSNRISATRSLRRLRGEAGLVGPASGRAAPCRSAT